MPGANGVVVARAALASSDHQGAVENHAATQYASCRILSDPGEAFINLRGQQRVGTIGKLLSAYLLKSVLGLLV